MRICLLVVGMALAGCETIKPYEKEFLLNPLMDDAGVAGLNSSMMSSASAGFEKLGGTGGATGGSSCPTCGG